MARHAVTHPLSGADLRTLLLVLSRHQINRAGWKKLGPVFLAVLGRLPITMLEAGLQPLLLRGTGAMPAPLFVIGHWRSGTTHLSNLLSKDEALGFVPPVAAGIPWECLTLGRWFRRQLETQLPKSRLIDKVPVRPDSPQEDEIGLSNMLPFSFMHAYYFPSVLQKALDRGLFWEGLKPAEKNRWRRQLSSYTRKLYVQQGNRRLVIRNPAHMARISELRRIFPGAQFIHIHRNPYRVFLSMQNFYRQLLPALALHNWEEAAVDAAILRTYDRLMHSYYAQSTQLSSQDHISVSFEALEADPLSLLQRIYDRLELGDFKQKTGCFERYLFEVGRYEKNSFADKATPDLPQVRAAWSEHFDRLGYSR